MIGRIAFIGIEQCLWLRVQFREQFGGEGHTGYTGGLYLTGMITDFLTSTQKQFAYYRSLGDKTLAQLSDDQLFASPGPESNSIAIMVGHLNGNMLSRWTDFLTSDGEKEWRHRDREFEPVIQSRQALEQKWNEGWDCLFTALGSINESNFNQLVYIRNQGHTIIEAVHRQLAHYAYHVGQIVYLGHQLKGEEWTSLSIAKGQSAAFNAEKFAKEKKRGHFTDE